MCGISGFVDTGRRQDDRELRATVLPNGQCDTPSWTG
jgi:hypothetical protein